MVRFKKIYVYTDGGSRGNPGPGAVGVLVCDTKGRVLCKKGEYIGETTNNRAEYTALIKALEVSKKYCKIEVNCFSDSQLMVRQLNGEYKVKNYYIKKLFTEVKKLEKNFKKVDYQHVPRENKQIKIVDRLLNKELDSSGH